MCGRYALHSRPDVISAAFGVPEFSQTRLRFNIAPSQLVAAVRQKPGTHARELVKLCWGLVPSWAGDPSIGNRLANARSETVAEKPSFRHAFKSQRYLLVADGFYEWQQTDGRKQPYYVRMKDGRPFGLAGLWERWGKGDAAIESCTVLTTDANSLMQPIHERMPVIVPPEKYRLWLDPAEYSLEVLGPLMRPYDAGELEAFPVSTFVNSPKHDGPECIEPLANTP
jgi:putative SOS response-associated peptidase YedK